MKINPLRDYILIEIIEGENVTKSGIWLSAEFKDRPKESVVLAVSKEIKGIKVKDRILFAKYGILKKSVGGVDFNFIKEECIIAILNDGFKPYGDNMLVDKVIENGISKGGIILDQKSSGNLHAWSKVLDIGYKITEIKIGYQVYFPKLLAWELDGGKLLVKQETILCMDDGK